MTIFHGLLAAGEWSAERGTNTLDSGAPYYDVYRTADDRYLAVGCLEARFYAELLERMGIDAGDLPVQSDRAGWDGIRARLADAFATRTQAQWCELLEGTDACVSPVLSPAEAPGHPHNVVRGTFLTVDGVVQPAPAPRFSRTPGAVRHGPKEPGADTDAALADWGFSADDVAALRAAGAVG
jgi:alpha-methylacyl-CoA racemase